jgi:hypothetical protein
MGGICTKRAKHSKSPLKINTTTIIMPYNQAFILHSAIMFKKDIYLYRDHLKEWCINNKTTSIPKCHRFNSIERWSSNHLSIKF